MHKPILNRWLAAACLLTPWIAQGAGLGNLNVLSSLGQPLLADIEIIAIDKRELSSITARIAPPDAYRRADLQYGAVLSGTRITVEKRPNGQPYLKVMSAGSVNEPFINLLIELDSPSGRIVRAYTALIDPPGYTPPESVASSTGAAPEVHPVLVPKAPVTVVPTPPARPAASREYGPVKRGETLSKIAAREKPEGVSLEQMLVGIFRSNPDAFMKNDMNRMKAGKTLQIPGKERLTAVPQPEAAQEVRLQAANWNRYRRKLADTAGTAAERKNTGRKPETAHVKVEDKAEADKGAKDVLKLSSGVPPGRASKKRSIEDRVQALEEELIAREKALNEANQRIKELEKAVKETGK